MAAAAPNMTDLFGSDDDEDEPMDEAPKTAAGEPYPKEADDEAKEAAAKPAEPSMADLFGEDDEDEEEEVVEEVVVPAEQEDEAKDAETTKPPVAKKNKKLMNELFGDDDDDDDEASPGAPADKTFDWDAEADDDEEFRASDIKQGSGQGSPRAVTDHKTKRDGPAHKTTALEPVARRPDVLECALPAAPTLGPTRAYRRATVVKVPKFLEFEPTAYDANAFRASLEDGDEPPAPAVVRWRYKRDPATGAVARDPATGAPLKESNARLVKYADGSMQLVIGADQCFDVDERPFLKSVGGASSSSGGGGTPARRPPAAHAAKKHARLFAKGRPRNANTVLLGVCALDAQLSFLPPSLESETHKAFTQRARSHALSNKKKVKELFATENPERAQLEKAKLREDEIKRDARRRQRLETAARGRASKLSGDHPRPRMDARYLEFDENEDEDDQQTYSLKAVKRAARRQHAKALARDEADDDDDEDDDMGDFIADDDEVEEEDEEEEEEEDDDDDDDDDERKQPSKGGSASSSASRPRRHIQADDDDDDDDD
eukprot:CAMPEP_0185703328 /NCGR_PEP_ID=MMETSP1164-20130828/14225_1 /TAXON_ID=1104430 /ORGANISM="Chrysoreinhardia sp, Strain CCMP2950" /LENGTH=546 /DNA_ID=CAMNT_0028370611 /DNA_START=23 /DNA_END=1663 /DNA_ORIENTATION=+